MSNISQTHPSYLFYLLDSGKTRSWDSGSLNSPCVHAARAAACQVKVTRTSGSTKSAAGAGAAFQPLRGLAVWGRIGPNTQAQGNEHAEKNAEHVEGRKRSSGLSDRVAPSVGGGRAHWRTGAAHTVTERCKNKEGLCANVRNKGDLSGSFSSRAISCDTSGG